MNVAKHRAVNLSILKSSMIRSGRQQLSDIRNKGWPGQVRVSSLHICYIEATAIFQGPCCRLFSYSHYLIKFELRYIIYLKITITVIMIIFFFELIYFLRYPFHMEMLTLNWYVSIFDKVKDPPTS